mmetsp:Transcript_108347/g.170894  ORF Transcript_108347/g.170894 Transcript_108347/m.170894 type:complete len:226 (+) Transcript_108347:94-771(+)
MGCGASAKKAVYSAQNGEEQTKQTSDGGKAASSNSRPSGAGEVLSPGTRVRIEGLTGAVELNGKVAVVCNLNESTGRYVVEIQDGGGQKSLKKENLIVQNAPTVVSTSGKKSGVQNTPTVVSTSAKKSGSKKTETSAASGHSASGNSGDFTLGDRVRVGGLNGAIDLNGKLAVVFGVDKPTGRYIVEFENGAGQRKLKADNLTAMGTATGPLAAKARLFADMSNG